MIDKKTIEEILNIAVNAPSGNNSQPWRFEISENKISIFNLPNSDKFLFNYQQRGSFIAHGALIENILIVASEKGYEGNVEIFPNKEDKNLVSVITLQESSAKYKHNNLYPCILKRTTNRKPFEKVILKDNDRKEIYKFFEYLDDFGIKIILTEDKNTISELSRSLSMADRLIFENFDIHKAFFAKVSWTRQEEAEKGEGLYVGTKELSPVMKFLFKNFFSNWNFLKILSKIKISQKAGKQREKLYNNCSAIGLVFAESDLPEDFINTGRILQLFWLKITSLGLSFQPVSAGLLYIGQRLKKENVSEFSKDQVDFINKAYQNILNIFNNPKEIPTFSFRIGYSEPPGASSIKRAPSILWK